MHLPSGPTALREQRGEPAPLRGAVEAAALDDLADARHDEHARGHHFVDGVDADARLRIVRIPFGVKLVFGASTTRRWRDRDVAVEEDGHDFAPCGSHAEQGDEVRVGLRVAVVQDHPPLPRLRRPRGIVVDLLESEAREDNGLRRLEVRSVRATAADESRFDHDGLLVSSPEPAPREGLRIDAELFGRRPQLPQRPQHSRTQSSSSRKQDQQCHCLWFK